MRALPVLLVLVACGAGAWFLIAGGDGEPDLGTLPEAVQQNDPRRPPEPTPLPMELDIVVVPEEPADLWSYDPEDASGTLFDQERLHSTRIRWPDEAEVVTGEMLLKALQTGFDATLRFGGQDQLDAFKQMRLPMAPPHWETLFEIVGRIEARGWALVERDGGIWVYTVEGRPPR